MKVQSISLGVPAFLSELSSGVLTVTHRINTFLISMNGKTNTLADSFVNSLKERRVRSGQFGEFSGTQPGGKKILFNKFPGLRKYAKWFALTLLLVLIIFAGFKLLKSPNKKADTPTTDIVVKPPIASMNLNKELTFPLQGDKGTKVADIKYLIESAELRNEILVNGQKATAVQGREFLILTIKITNDYKSSIQINSRDYVRLSVNGNKDEWLAPDIHNDPVEVQAISTKYTRLGFAINSTDKELLIRAGEVSGEKQDIPLDFKK